MGKSFEPVCAQCLREGKSYPAVVSGSEEYCEKHFREHAAKTFPSLAQD